VNAGDPPIERVGREPHADAEPNSLARFARLPVVVAAASAAGGRLAAHFPFRWSLMMKKLRLELIDLKVESFASVPVRDAAGAVRGHDATIGAPCDSICWCPIGWSDFSCPDLTCSAP
jgi:hypothetical protein